MANRNFRYVDDWASIRLVDSFVKENKAGTGNGEASLYLGSKYDPDIFDFFGEEAFVRLWRLSEVLSNKAYDTNFSGCIEAS